jgi:mono/diheme cytochrome c family protein
VKLAALVGALAVLSACAPLVRPTEAHVTWAGAKWPDVTLAELQRGRTLYVDNCSGCHTLVRPETRPPDEWPERIDEMQDEHDVRLSDEDRRAVVRYLEAASAIPTVPKG